jgi:phosphosulfolactate phosphohydrolase-like enzyme
MAFDCASSSSNLEQELVTARKISWPSTEQTEAICGADKTRPLLMSSIRNDEFVEESNESSLSC